MAKPSSRPAVSLGMRVALLLAVCLLAWAVPAASAEPLPSEPVCQLVASGPDAVVYLCVDVDAPCRVYTVTHGHEGAVTTRCLVA